MKKLAVFISGYGSNLETIANFCIKNTKLAKVSIVISNKANVNGILIAEKYKIPSFVVPTKGIAMEQFENECEKLLVDIDYICLAGFMRVLTQQFINKWRSKIINIHPSLLPSFKGVNAIKDALEYGVKITGCTVHFAEEEIDSGRIIVQKAVEIQDNETEDSLKNKIKAIEKIAYTEALHILCN